jgi:hypothetical protein
VQRVRTIGWIRSAERFFRLGDDPLAQSNEAIQLTTGLPMTTAVKGVGHTGCLLDHVGGYLFELLDGFLTRFGVLPVELLDPEEDPLSGSAEGAKGFLKGNLLADPLNLPDDLLLDPMKQISVGGISNVLRL